MSQLSSGSPVDLEVLQVLREAFDVRSLRYLIEKIDSNPFAQDLRGLRLDLVEVQESAERILHREQSEEAQAVLSLADQAERVLQEVGDLMRMLKHAHDVIQPLADLRRSAASN
ncbi:hypothetical protein [Cupriavidus sp. BIC8F]|uniref:hypothetical protein n=1 Tax=Cupriavidus sp. BIC8F TaxID=3079014 RepID=UPI002915F04F|nr:hypothetical protein [Cupriavidus sp. BIC8F]